MAYLAARRRFLSALSRAVVAAVPALAWAKTARSSPQRDSEPGEVVAFMRWTESRFDSPEAARSVGRAYLAKHARYGERGLLMRELFGDYSGASHDALCQAYVRRCREDFDRHDIVLVDGWVLAASEVKLCALLALA